MHLFIRGNRHGQEIEEDGTMKIDGELSDEQKIITGMLEDYCRKNVAPAYDGWIRDRVFPRKLMKDLSELVLGTVLPSTDHSADEVTLGLISELMGKYEIPVPAFLTMHFAKLLPLITDRDTREKYLEKYRKGELVICGGFTEPGQGSDSASISTTAMRNGDRYEVNGEKSFVSSPGIADVHILSVRTSQQDWSHRHRGISLLTVDAGEKGVEPYEMESMASVFRGDFGGIRLNNVSVPRENIIGTENGGFQTLMKILNTQRVHVGLYTIGLAEISLSEAIEYAKTRKTFGQPISKHQAVAFRLAEDWSRLEAVKLLAYKALALQDNGMDNSAECAAVKWHGCEVAFEAVSHAMQTFGAAGYVRTSAIERRFRGARGFLIGDGTPDIQKLIISRKLFGREYSP